MCAHCAVGHVGLRYLCGVLATEWKALVRVEGGVAQFVRTAAKATGSCQPSLGVVIAVSSSISEMMTGSRAFGHVPVGACASTWTYLGSLCNETARWRYQTPQDGRHGHHPSPLDCHQLPTNQPYTVPMTLNRRRPCYAFSDAVSHQCLKPNARRKRRTKKKTPNFSTQGIDMNPQVPRLCAQCIHAREVTRYASSPWQPRA